MSVVDAMLTNQDGSEALGPEAARKLLLLQGVGEVVSSAAAGRLNAKGRPGRYGVASVSAMWSPAVSLVVLISGGEVGGRGDGSEVQSGVAIQWDIDTGWYCRTLMTLKVLPRLPRHGSTCMVTIDGTLGGWLWWAFGDRDGLLMQGL